MKESIIIKIKNREYYLLIEEETYEDGSIVYTAFCPSLNISDYGDTIQQVIANIKTGIRLAIESH